MPAMFTFCAAPALSRLPTQAHYRGRYRAKGGDTRLSQSGRPERGARKQEEVKSSFYKRPSKAFERGGGFYVPGLRGPRLRAAVAVLIAVLLAINHGSVPRVTTREQRLSELFAISAALTTLVSAWVSLQLEAQEEGKLNKLAAQSAASAEQTAKNSVEVIEEESSATFDPTSIEHSSTSTNRSLLTDAFQSDLRWATSLVFQQTAVDCLSVFVDNSLIFGAGPSFMALKDDGVGEVVRRVTKEGVELYVDDTGQLPSGVTLPFVRSPRAAAFLLPFSPVRGGVLVVAASLDAAAPDSKPGLSASDRTWIRELILSRIESGAEEGIV